MTILYYIAATIISFILIHYIFKYKRSKAGIATPKTSSQPKTEFDTYYDKQVKFLEEMHTKAFHSEDVYTKLKARIRACFDEGANPYESMMNITSVLALAYMQGDDFNEANDSMQSFASKLLQDEELKSHYWTLMSVLGSACVILQSNNLLGNYIVAVRPRTAMKYAKKEQP